MKSIIISASVSTFALTVLASEALPYCTPFSSTTEINHKRQAEVFPKHLIKREQQPLSGEGDRRCGPGIGSCASGECCSGAGWCGTTTEYCFVPQNCQEAYGWCDSKQWPAGDLTSTIKRKSFKQMPITITGCTKPQTLALSFDDGPSAFTSGVLDVLEKHNAHATFFLGGNINGRGAVDTHWNSTLLRMHDAGHQIGSHTWSHPNLDTLSSAQRKDEMIKNEMAISNVIGSFPRFMRAPMIICGQACQKDMHDLGYQIVDWQYDSQDWMDPIKSVEEQTSSLINSMDTIDVNDNMFIIQHDIHGNTAAVSDAVLQHMAATKPGWKAVTISECLGLESHDAMTDGLNANHIVPTLEYCDNDDGNRDSWGVGIGRRGVVEQGIVKRCEQPCRWDYWDGGDRKVWGCVDGSRAATTTPLNTLVVVVVSAVIIVVTMAY